MGAGVRSHPFLTLEFQWLLVCVFIPAVCMQWNGNLSAYETASFDNPIQLTGTVTTRLDHFTLHPDTGDVYVGAVNYLYRLNKNLVQVANVSTATCTGQTCLNYNKVLVLQDGRLVTCGSENGGRCQSRREGDLTEDSRGNDERFQVAAYDIKTTEGIVAPGPGGQSDLRLYVATSYGTEDEGRGNIPPITRRSLAEGDMFMHADDDDKITLSGDYTASPFPINYVSVFVWNGFTYFVTFQGTSVRQGGPYASKITRVCHGSEDLDSYSEIFIQCSGPDSSVFSLVQAAYVGPAGPHLFESLALDAADQVLYTVFAKNQGSVGSSDMPIADSALCLYKMSDIEAEFEDAVRGCLAVRDDNEIGYLHGSLCNGGLNDILISTYIDGLLCQARVAGTPIAYRFATGMAPGLSRLAVTQLPGHLASSIITSIELNHTVAFIGTSQGQLLKVHIESGDPARLYEIVSLDGRPVMRDTKLTESIEELYVLTEQKLIKMRVENCSQYTSCEECIGTEAGMDGDPYCGWCTLERRCTRYHDCPLPDVSTRWLAYNEAQCIEIADVTPHNSLPITVTDQQITLTVQQLPDLLDGQQYVCRFGDHFDGQAITTGEILRCMTPPADRIPGIPSPEDHVTVVLSVMSTETGVDFVDIDFSFYECNTHTTCVSCADSDWACDWCVFENRCTHNSSTCSGDNEIIVTGRNNRNSLMEGPDACPQLQAQDGEVLVPNAVSRAITVNVSNLPDDSSLITGYQCSLDINGTLQSMTATRDDLSMTCDTRIYTYAADVQELNVSLTLNWMDTNNMVHQLDDRHGFKVTLYKCEVLRPDCSRCVSDETTRAELGCAWCGTTGGTCAVNDSATCLSAGRIVTPDNMLNCPAPVILGFYPLYGPIEGNTRLTLNGTDLGRMFSDITEVTVGGQMCDLTGQDMYYRTGESVSCITGGSSDLTPQSLQVTITGADGTEQSSSQEDQTFQYKDPNVTDFNPKVGPQSGGTQVTISGENLDAGRDIEASIDGMSCSVKRAEVSDSSITCLTSRAEQLGSWTLSVSFDGAMRSAGLDYEYAKDPQVVNIQPSSSVLAGGRELKVNGSGFSIIQQPQILITRDNQKFIEDCKAESDTIMSCTSPRIDLPNQVLGDSSVNVSTGFIMDGVTDLLNWCDLSNQESCTPMEYFQNPEYYPFTDEVYGYENGIGLKNGETLLIRGARLNLAITNAEVTVYIGPGLCTEVTVNRQALSCRLPENQPAAGDYLGMTNYSMNLPVVWVIHGETLTYNIGYFQYSTLPIALIVACTVSVGVLLIAVILTVVLYRRSQSAQKEVEKHLDEIDRAQQQIADDMRDAFAELQTEVTDLTRDLEGVGMPFVSEREYATNMLFLALETKPSTYDPENPEEHVEKAMMKFCEALSNKSFLLTFLQTLDAESQSKLPVREKCEIASLITVIMLAEGKLAYLTDVLFSLMAKLVQDELDANRPKQLFRRTETILEKLLSNWIALCLYDSLKDYTANPLFLLYRAIKCHSEHGPMDVVSGKAKYTLSDDVLLTADVEFNEMTLNVIVDDDGETKEVKVLDVDTISQVKEKILDAIHRNKPYSSRPSSNQVDLEWRQGKGGQLVLRDIDATSAMLDGWKKINTLRFFHIPNKSTMALVPASAAPANPSPQGAYANLGYSGKQSNRYTVVEMDTEETANIWHLTKVEDGSNEYINRPQKPHYTKRASLMPSRPKKRLREIYIPRLLSTKGTIQDYINRMFDAILHASNAPVAVKYLFDFFDSQAVRHSIQDPDAVRIWKGNSLSLRFWSNVIRRPDYIFDIRPSRSVEASLGVIAQAFYDAHNASGQKLGKDSDLSKLLFNKDLMRIDALVQGYYDGIADRPRVSIKELNEEMATTSQNFTGLFSKLSTLLQLWDCVKKFNQKIVEALEEDEVGQQEHLAYKLVQVETILSNEDCDAEEQV